MKKTIRKFRPTEYWRIGEHESWLADMATEGLHLKKIGFVFAQFVQGEPKQMRYRIDVSPKDNKKQMYAESGWEYVTSYGEFNVFSSPVELNAPEFYTDPVEQSDTLKALDKRLTVNAIVVGVLVFLMIAMLFFVFFDDPSPTLSLIEGRTLQQAIMVIVYLYLGYTSLQAAKSIRTLRKNLSKGKPINHHAPWKKQKRRTYAVFMIFLVVALFATIFPFMQLTLSKTETLPETNINLPIVRLADVEQNPTLVRDNSSTQDNMDRLNEYNYHWSLLAPVQYQSDEQGFVPNEMWKDGSGRYSPSIHTRVYKLSLPFMKESVLSDLIKRYGVAKTGGEFIKMNNPGFDSLIVHEGNGFKEVFAFKGKGVMHVQYFGYANMDTIIETVAQKIAFIAN